MTYAMISVFLALITAFIFIKFEGNVKAAYKSAIDKGTCKSSVETAAKLKFRYVDFSEEIKCPAVKLEINEKNEEKAKKMIADAMFDCWDQFGRGKPDLFTDDAVYCTICHRITFGNDVKINGLTKYLATKNAPGQELSYLQFLTTEKTENSEFLNELESKKIEDSIDASKNNEYTIIFTYIKGKKYLEEYLEKAKYTTPGVGLMALGLGAVYYSPAIAAAVSSVATPAFGVPVGGFVASLGTITFGIGILWSYLTLKFAGIPFDHIALISFVPYDAQNLQNLNCMEIPIKQ